MSFIALAALACPVAGLVQAEDRPASRWSAENPPTPTAINPIPSVASATPSPPLQNRQEPGNELRRLPPVEDTPPAAEPTPSLPPEPPRAPAQPAAPVDWSTPQVVVGPQPHSRMVSHEEMISTPPASDARASRFSRLAESSSESNVEQVAAAQPSRYSTPQALQPVSPLRQPVFARVFDETDSSADSAETPIAEKPVAQMPVGETVVAETAVAESAVADAPTAEVAERLSPIFACRLLGLPATQERTAADKRGEGTTRR